MNLCFYRRDAKVAKKKIYQLPGRGRQLISFAIPRVFFWPEAVDILINPASHGIDQI